MKTRKRRERSAQLQRNYLTPEQERLLREIREAAGAKTNAQPRFLVTAKMRARQLGISVDEVLQNDIRFLNESCYPGPECFTPNEIETLRLDGGLSQSRESHLDNCEHCRVLVANTNPDPKLLEELLEHVRSDFFVASSKIGMSRIAQQFRRIFKRRSGKPEVVVSGGDLENHDQQHHEIEHAGK